VNGIVFTTMNPLREIRREAGLGQREFAALLSVPLETLRTWDSGRRPVPPPVLHRAAEAVTQSARLSELLPLRQLAEEFHIHVRTWQAAVRAGKLEAQFSRRSVFGRPLRFATRAAAMRFIAIHYRRSGRRQLLQPPLPFVPSDYDRRLRTLRDRLRLTQGGFAQRIGAASKAVIYQWESRKRTPSPVFWQQVLRLEQLAARPGTTPVAGATTLHHTKNSRGPVRAVATARSVGTDPHDAAAAARTRGDITGPAGSVIGVWP
jgi:DNA-binding transcriptional regulator YiaG